MKRLFFVGVLAGLFFCLSCRAGAANIEAILEDEEGLSSFSVIDSGAVEVSRIDSNGNIQADGTITTDAALYADEVKILESGTEPTHHTILQSGDLTGADVTFTLPINDGDANQVLKTDGGGVLSWTAAGAGTVGGSGSAGFIPYWSDSSTLTNSLAKYSAVGLEITGWSIIHAEDTANFLKLFGGTNGDGANLVLFGSTEDTTPGEVEINIAGAGIVDINANVDVSGTLKIGAYTLPNTDGSDTQLLQTNGLGAVTWATVSGGNVSGDGTDGKIPYWTGLHTLADSELRRSDAGKYEIGSYSTIHTENESGSLILLGGTGDDEGGKITVFGKTYTGKENQIELYTPYAADINLNGYVLAPHGIKIGAYTLPNTDGTDTQLLQTNGTGTVTWETVSGGNVSGTGGAGFIPYWSDSSTLTNSLAKYSAVGLEITGWSIIHAEDTANFLKLFGGTNGDGANLVLFGSTEGATPGEVEINIAGAGIVDINANVDVSGTLKIGAYTLPNTDGTDTQLLQTNGTGTVTWETVSGGNVSGTGGAGYIPYWSDSNTLGNSPIKRMENGNGIELTSYGIICKDNTGSYVKLCGGTEGDGGNLVLFGSTEGTTSSEVEINAAGGVDINANVDVSGTLAVDGTVTIGADDDAFTTDITLNFGGTNQQSIQYDSGEDNFYFSDDIDLDWAQSLWEINKITVNDIVNFEGIRIGADAANNEIDDESNGDGSTTLYIGTATISHSFTGWHYYELGDKDLEVGEIVRLEDGKIYRTTDEMDKKAIGIYWGITDHESSMRRKLSSGKYAYAVACVGDSYEEHDKNPLTGAWVCDEGGEIEEGDLLISASKDGFLKKQDDDLIHSYTIAKARENIKFGKSGENNNAYIYLLQ